ncbi:hypothetical protein PENTCL1PPCAC_27693 [Pristionchus entomophagus]|uniref:RING-type domain-containing protein n=1 Tax=Pristionchus entomophagus TaxID=358040 RepID=A0AAV5UGK7_9BILA|nr:hypothetical protein PENTCL1PPCAC_27693 [Pristionchus entomophagus]
MSFIVDLIFRRIFILVEEDGYRCKTCKGLHPKYNSVVWQDIVSHLHFELGDCRVSKSDLDGDSYICVWCAMDESSSQEVRIIDPGHVPPNKAADERLKSIDRKQINNEAGSAIIAQCCSCASRIIDRKHNYPKCIILRCGHICHEHHLTENTWWPGKSMIYCNFCKMEYDYGEVMNMKRVFHINDYFNNLEKFSWGTCKACESLHPEDNLRVLAYDDPYTSTCVWCGVVEIERMRQRSVEKRDNRRS